MKYFYRLILMPLGLFLTVILRPFVSKKIQDIIRVREDENAFEIRHPLKKVIWFHCSSGEFEYARPLIRELKLRHPEYQVLVTYFSTSYVKAIRGMEEVDALGPLPWDTPRHAKQFLDRFPIQKAFFARTDVWPELSTELKNRHIPSLLFSLSLSEKSSRARFPTRLVTTWALSQLSHIFCVSDKDLEALRALGIITPTTVTGDTRYDQVFFRLEHRRHLLPLSIASENFVFVAGSTWPEDEKVLLKAWASLPENFRLILVPHEPTPPHMQEIKLQLESHGLSSQLYSEGLPHLQKRVLLVDEMGILAELYSLGHAAFVGGSFKKDVHSVMEPLALGLVTFIGPYHHNNREALQFMNFKVDSDFSAVTEFGDSEELQAKILSLHKFISQADCRAKDLILEKMHQSRGASDRILRISLT